MSDSFTYIHHENGIHQIIWHDFEQASARAYILLLNDLFENCPENSTLRILLDYRHGVKPIFRLMIQGMKDLTLRDDIQLRIAHIYSDVFYPVIVQNAALVARFNANRRFFREYEEEDALEWLMAE